MVLLFQPRGLKVTSKLYDLRIKLIRLLTLIGRLLRSFFRISNALVAEGNLSSAIGCIILSNQLAKSEEIEA